MAHPEVPEELSAALAAHGEQLLAELQLLSELPQVRLTAAAVFDRAKPRGSVAQQRGVICKLTCCGGQLDVKCNDRSDDRACPTHVEAAQRLREKVLAQHGSPSCLERARRAAEGASASAPPANAFAQMLGAQVALQRAATALTRAEQRLEAARAHEAEAARVRGAAEQQLRDAQDEARRVGLLGAKKQKAAAARPPHFDRYSQYDEARWLATTGEIMNRRAVEVQAGVQAKAPPDGAEGALLHWRRGLVGAVQDWACGSEDTIIILLVRLIAHFKLADKVVEALAGMQGRLVHWPLGRVAAKACLHVRHANSEL